MLFERLPGLKSMVFCTIWIEVNVLTFVFRERRGFSHYMEDINETRLDASFGMG